MLAWPHAGTDWSYMLDDVERCYVALAHEIAREHPLIIIAPDTTAARTALADIADDRVLFFDVPTNDTWTRDYGPISVIDNGRPVAVDFTFNGWGLKFASDCDNLVNSRMHDAGLLCGAYESRLGFVLEGGSIESDGRGTLLTTSRCLLSPNRNGAGTFAGDSTGDLRADVGRYLHDALGFERVLWLDYGYLAGDDTDSHIDTLARMAPDDTILYVQCQDPADEHYEELAAMERQLKTFTTADGRPYNLVALPMPDAIYDEDGERLPATYANYLATDRAVYMPSYGQPDKDLLARRMMAIVFPNHRIVSVDCRALIRQHGSLHCATMQIPKELLPL